MQNKKTQPITFDGPEGQEDMPYLLTPGPLTTSRQVKLTMLADWGSRDIEFRQIVKSIRQRLCDIAQGKTEGEDKCECVLMQGAGTFAVEAAIGAFCPSGRKKKTLVLINGAYGKRAANILTRLKRPVETLQVDEETPISAADVEAALKADRDIEMVFVVHCETTTGIINPLEEICQVCKAHDRRVLVDAMSSFGGMALDMAGLDIDILVSSANKCIEGVPGFGYVLVKRALLEASKGKSHSLSLDLYDQWQGLEQTGQFRFTPPTHTLVAFDQALREHAEEGGVRGRQARYQQNQRKLVTAMRQLGFETLLDDEYAGPIIQTFLSPGDANFRFDGFYEALRRRGFAIYPGKLTKRDSFRIGTIGQLDESVFPRLIKTIRDVLGEMGVTDLTPQQQVD